MGQTTSLEYKSTDEVIVRDQSAGTPWFFWLSDSFLEQKTFLGQLLRKIRRTFFSVFYKEYVRASVAANREGDCTRCGACCKLVYKCPFLGYDTEELPYCRIYGELRPASCQNYPFDRVDADVEECGFRFKQ